MAQQSSEEKLSRAIAALTEEIRQSKNGDIYASTNDTLKNQRKLRKTETSKVLLELESQIDEIIATDSSNIRDIKGRKERLKKILSSVEKNKESFKSSEYDDLLDQMNKANTALSDDLKKKKSSFTKSKNFLEKYKYDMAAISSGVVGSNPVMMLAFKMIGDGVKARKEKKKEEQREARENTEKLKEAFEAELEKELNKKESNLPDNDPFKKKKKSPAKKTPMPSTDGRGLVQTGQVGILEKILYAQEETFYEVFQTRELLQKSLSVQENLYDIQQDKILDDLERDKESRVLAKAQLEARRDENRLPATTQEKDTGFVGGLKDKASTISDLLIGGYFGKKILGSGIGKVLGGMGKGATAAKSLLGSLTKFGKVGAVASVGLAALTKGLSSVGSIGKLATASVGLASAKIPQMFATIAKSSTVMKGSLGAAAKIGGKSLLSSGAVAGKMLGSKIPILGPLLSLGFAASTSSDDAKAYGSSKGSATFANLLDTMSFGVMGRDKIAGAARGSDILMDRFKSSILGIKENTTGNTKDVVTEKFLGLKKELSQLKSTDTKNFTDAQKEKHEERIRNLQEKVLRLQEKYFKDMTGEADTDKPAAKKYSDEPAYVPVGQPGREAYLQKMKEHKSRIEKFDNLEKGFGNPKSTESAALNKVLTEQLPKDLREGLNAQPMNTALGSVSQKYESGNLGVGAISSGKGDPGGKSYGSYQLSSNKGTLSKYLQNSQYADQFAGLKPGSAEFDAKWKELSNSDPSGFKSDQHAFIKKTHYDPAEKLAREKGFDVNDPRIQEAIFSMSVQHGKYGKIFDKADSSGTAEEQLQSLYSARGNYVQGLSDLPGGTKASIHNRYKGELNDLMSMKVNPIPKESPTQLASLSKSNNMLRERTSSKPGGNTIINNNTTTSGGGGTKGGSGNGGGKVRNTDNTLQRNFDRSFRGSAT